jgi:hypothetical protein
MPRRAWAWTVPAVLLGLAAAATLYVPTTPRYALYRLGVAVQQHDVAAAEAYFDVERIADRAAEVLVADYLARQPAPATQAEANGRELVAGLAKRRLRPQVVARVRAEIRRNVERAGAQQAAIALPVGMVAVLRTFTVSREGTDAWVGYEDRVQGPVRFRMARRPGESWKISEFDPDWVRRRAREEPIPLR